MSVIKLIDGIELDINFSLLDGVEIEKELGDLNKIVEKLEQRDAVTILTLIKIGTKFEGTIQELDKKISSSQILNIITTLAKELTPEIPDAMINNNIKINDDILSKGIVLIEKMLNDTNVKIPKENYKFIEKSLKELKELKDIKRY